MNVHACRGCGVRYRLKISRCPRCHGTEFEEQPMGKISVHVGATHAEDVPEPVAPLVDDATTGEALLDEGGEPASDPGTGGSASNEKPPTKRGRKPRNPEPPAPTTENPSEPDETEPFTAPSTGGDPVTAGEASNTPEGF